MPDSVVDPQAAQRGAQLFAQRCASCHAIKPGEQSRDSEAPNLRGRYDSSSRRITINAQTQEVQNETIRWDDKTLDNYLKGPKMTRAGRPIAFEPVTKEQDRIDLIAYLKSMRGGS
ncbi:Cytochrome c OS=Theileria annulata GN=TA12950 PE=3 SV=1 [Rhizoctonia solani AG-1 IB]|uniref:Cytochrome c n=1 Tax=Thanatephorus cucumeris (strain AG1-IB / isolate 7/3/14) TaxID=1108050 RepID=A0A0B7FAG8_THACB|nr:Cytochrome c OS=Theileria annulata GN=TA12950 PE=3 SV=1 [Rhizoctonia solani AG-1 IB]